MKTIKLCAFLLVIFLLGSGHAPPPDIEHPKIGDVYVLREGRVVLDVSHGIVIYKQAFFFEATGWTFTTNAMPIKEFTNRWWRADGYP